MKGLGKAAIVLTILFFVFLIPAGILIALGAVQVNNDYDVQGALNDVVENIGEYGTMNHNIGDVNKVSFRAVYTPDGDISLITLEKAAYEVNIVRNTDDELVVEHTGNYPYSLVSKYGITDGTEYSVDGSEDDYTTPFYFTETNGALAFGLETEDASNGLHLNAGKGYGKVTVYLPASYKGDLTIDSSAAELDMEGLELGTLTLSEAAGDFDASACAVDRLVINGVAGDIDYDGTVGSLEISGGMGDYDLDLTAPLTGASIVKGCMGNVNITLPAGSKVNVTSSGTLGNVDVDNSLVDGSGVAFEINGCLGNFSLDAN